MSWELWVGNSVSIVAIAQFLFLVGFIVGELAGAQVDGVGPDIKVDLVLLDLLDAAGDGLIEGYALLVGVVAMLLSQQFQLFDNFGGVDSDLLRSLSFCIPISDIGFIENLLSGYRIVRFVFVRYWRRVF